MREIVVDNFAGGGGASTGIENAIGRSVDIAINHDPAAIAMHRANHPTTRHFCEDVWEVDPIEACKGEPVALAWFSPDCTHHSRAKGGKPVDKNIRGLAWVAVRWAYMVRPRVLMLENVEEFRDWGPLDKKSRPIKERAGETFDGFIRALTTGISATHPAYAEMCDVLKIEPDGQMAQALQKGLGYDVDHRLLRACDYGAPTIRRRFFLIGRSDGKPISWPEPTHAEPDSLEVISGLKKPWVPVADVLDFSLPCPSIFATSEEIMEKYGLRAQRPLADATMKRIARGVMKFVINNPEPFIIEVNHSGDDFRGQSLDDPMTTITAKHGRGIVEPVLAPVEIRNNHGASGNDVREPLRTITTGGHHMLVTPVMMCNNENAAGSDVQDPINTITTGGHHMLVTPNLIQYHAEQSDDVRGQSIDQPLMTVDASNRYGLVSTFISKYYGGENVQASGVDKPLPTVTAIDHNAVCAVSVTQFNNNSVGQEVTKPLNTTTAQTNHFGEVRAFLVKYYGSGQNVTSCKKPCPTITAKDRMGLVTISGQDYQIVDIGLRMLTPRELFCAQGFADNYIIEQDADGNPISKANQVDKCGNSVCPPIPAALVRVNLPEICA